MKIIECYINAGGFDYKMICGGISIYVWNLAQHFAKAGHEASIVTAAHGQIDYLKSKYNLTKLSKTLKYNLPIVLDKSKWKGFESEVSIPLETEIYKLRLENVDIYLLSNEYLNKYSDTFYPPYDVKGKDLGFYKYLVFQVDFIKFVREYFKDEKVLLHAHEPFYQYLIPPAFKDDPNVKVVSTVQSNMPVNKKIYKPKLEKLLSFLDCPVDLSPIMDKKQTETEFEKCIRQYLPVTHLNYDYPDNDYVNFYSLVLKYSDGIDFLSEGQKYFYSTFAGTAFEDYVKQFTVYNLIKENYNKMFVGWCAISDEWFVNTKNKISKEKKSSILSSLGLNPAYPTFYHNARYAVEHKGQVELMRAIDTYLSKHKDANFIIRCLSGNGIDSPYFNEVIKKYPENLYFEWQVQKEEKIIEYSQCADFCLFPSKFEMDTFLIAQGEAMLFGAVPIASRQEGMRHWNHAKEEDDPEVSGYSVRRSFQENDSLLADDLYDKIRKSVVTFNNEPQKYKKISENAVKTANIYNWGYSAKSHLFYMEKIFNGEKSFIRLEDILDTGWYDLVDKNYLEKNYDAMRKASINRGDLETFEKHFKGELKDYKIIFDKAFENGKFGICEAIISKFPKDFDNTLIHGRISAKSDDKTLSISYNFANADRVEVFIPNKSFEKTSSEIARKLQDFTGIFMNKENNKFFTDINLKEKTNEIYFLVTLKSGNVSWDRVKV